MIFSPAARGIGEANLIFCQALAGEVAIIGSSNHLSGNAANFGNILIVFSTDQP